MKRLRIIGAGGHGKVVADIAVACGYTDIAFLDQSWPERTRNGAWPIVGKHDSEGPLFCAVGDNETRAKIMQGQGTMPCLIHSSAILSPSARCGAGTAVMAGSIINADTQIGSGVILNTGSSVDHDCMVSDFAHISPGARLAGGVHVGARTWIGDWRSRPRRCTYWRGTLLSQQARLLSKMLQAVPGWPACQLKKFRKLSMLNTPFAPWPSYSQEEADAISRVLLSGKVNYWTGTECRSFEKEFAAFAGTKHAVAVANGTLALDLALQGLGIGSHYGGNANDEVIVTSRSFIASVSTIVNAGARPVFADVNVDSQNIDAATVRAVTTANTRAVICVHLAGWPCDMDAIRSAVGQDVKLIEDCAQAHGALYKGQPVGGIGDIGAWSFCQDKIMTTGGEGGMVTCNDEALWRKMWSFKDHGKSYEAVYERDHAPGFRWLHDDFGTNCRMTEIQAVIGRISWSVCPNGKQHAKAMPQS